MVFLLLEAVLDSVKKNALVPLSPKPLGGPHHYHILRANVSLRTFGALSCLCITYDINLDTKIYHTISRQPLAADYTGETCALCTMLSQSNNSQGKRNKFLMTTDLLKTRTQNFNRKVQGVPHSQAAANPRHQEEEKEATTTHAK